MTLIFLIYLNLRISVMRMIKQNKIKAREICDSIANIIEHIEMYNDKYAKVKIKYHMRELSMLIPEFEIEE
jgi:hypothetical protein